MQDQLLAESEAAVPAEMVREFQVAGLSGGDIAQRLQHSPLIPAHSRPKDRVLPHAYAGIEIWMPGVLSWP